MHRWVSAYAPMELDRPAVVGSGSGHARTLIAMPLLDAWISASASLQSALCSEQRDGRERPRPCPCCTRSCRSRSVLPQAEQEQSPHAAGSSGPLARRADGRDDASSQRYHGSSLEPGPGWAIASGLQGNSWCHRRRRSLTPLCTRGASKGGAAMPERRSRKGHGRPGKRRCRASAHN
jgi:hypothetical protein